MKQYVQTALEADQQVANTLAELIIGAAYIHHLRLCPDTPTEYADQDNLCYGLEGIAPVRRDHGGSGNAPREEQNRPSLADSSQDDGLCSRGPVRCRPVR